MNCCEKTKKEKKEKGFLKGLLYGLASHTFCIVFIIFSVLGVTIATTLLKPLLLNPYFFYLLIVLSLIFTTISALIYLKKNGNLSFQGMKRKWKYLLTLYGTTLVINLLLFMVIFPIIANLNQGKTLTAALLDAFRSGEELQISETDSLITLQVNIPCPGHAPLIAEELKKINGVKNIRFRFPNLFDIEYCSQRTTLKTILSLEIFNTYKATIIK